MASKLVKLDDGLLVEIDVPGDQVVQIAGGVAEQVQSSFEKIKPVLLRVCRPLADTWKELNQEVVMEKAEVELGLSFEGEGNIFITKAKAGANLTVKLTMVPKPSESAHE
jgi:hypothetical protein